jgi:hypothetical protein
LKEGNNGAFRGLGAGPAGQGEKVFVYTKTHLILLPHQLIQEDKWESLQSIKHKHATLNPAYA